MKKIIFLVLSVLVISSVYISAGELEGNKLLKKMLAEGKQDPKSWHCSNCDKHFTTAAGLRNHLKNNDLKDYFPSICSVCNKELTAAGLSRHMNSAHGNGERVACTYDDCDYTAPLGSEINRHIDRFHLKIKRFKCGGCGGQFYERQSNHSCSKILWRRIVPKKTTGRKSLSRKRKRKEEASEDLDSDVSESTEEPPAPKRRSKRRASLAALKKLKKQSEDNEMKDSQAQPQPDQSEIVTASSLLGDLPLEGLPAEDAPEVLDLSELS